VTKTYPWLKPALFGAVFGAVAIMILGFSEFGWMLTSKAQGIANDRSMTAVAEALAPVCAARFFGQPDATAKLADLKKLPSDYEQRDYVEKGGWAVAAGSIAPDYELAAECAKKIIAGKPA
jgi:hypothetical protein